MTTIDNDNPDPDLDVSDADYEAMLAAAAENFAAEAAAWGRSDIGDGSLLDCCVVAEACDGDGDGEAALVEARAAELESRAVAAARLCVLRRHRLAAEATRASDRAACALAHLQEATTAAAASTPVAVAVAAFQEDPASTSASSGGGVHGGDNSSNDDVDEEQPLSVLDRSLSILVNSRLMGAAATS